ncbi:hypothetical protein DEH18_18165 [Streptomyces sp. NHF165]|nr:hypothetical protein DEH18_18165 [Streptomyces sp. NHF165]
MTAVIGTARSGVRAGRIGKVGSQVSAASSRARRRSVLAGSAAGGISTTVARSGSSQADACACAASSTMASALSARARGQWPVHASAPAARVARQTIRPPMPGSGAVSVSRMASAAVVVAWDAVREAAAASAYGAVVRVKRPSGWWEVRAVRMRRAWAAMSQFSRRRVCGFAPSVACR